MLAAVIAAGVYLYPRLTKKSQPENQLTLSGNIEAHESLVSFKVQGRIADLPVEEGQSVESGTLLARLDDADYRQKVRIDEANVHVRESNLALVLAGTREQELKASEQTMLDAQADLQQKKDSTTIGPSASSARTRYPPRTATLRKPHGSAPRQLSWRRNNVTTKPSKAAARKTSRSLAPMSRKPAQPWACRE